MNVYLRVLLAIGLLSVCLLLYPDQVLRFSFWFPLLLITGVALLLKVLRNRRRR